MPDRATPLKELKPGMGLYQVMHVPDKCSADKPFGVVNLKTGGVEGRCHATRDDALTQARAMYSQMGDKALVHSEEIAYVQPISKDFAESSSWIDDNKKWVKIYPYSSWSHPLFSDTTIDRSVAEQMVKNFNDGVYGVDVTIDYEHGMDPAKGSKAAGKYLSLEARDDGLWGLVEFTEPAKAEIQAGEWRYISGSHYDTWTNPHSNQTYQYVLKGGGLTNKPWIKEDMLPLNFSELYVAAEDKEFSVWSAAYINDLPDSAFLYIEAGGKKDSEGKTTPRSLRHFPVRDANGNVDLPHVRNALARIPQSDVSDAAKQTAIAKARRLLGKDHSEPSGTSTIGGHMEGNETQVVDESAGAEHSDPGTGSPPPERTDERNDDDAADTGSRRDTPPVVEENQIDSKLREVLGLDPDADILKAVTDMKAEVEPLREAAKSHSEAKAFSEAFPEQARLLDELRKRDLDHKAKSFSESFANITDSEGKPTGKGYPAVVREKLGNLYKEFSEGRANVTDLADVLKLIGTTGLVDYAESGSTNAGDIASGDDPAKAFSEKVAEIQVSDNIPYDTAVKLAAERHPAIFEGYRAQVRSGR